VSGNWKMHEDHAETQKFVQELAALLRVSGVPAGREVSIHPPFTSLAGQHPGPPTAASPMSVT